MKVGDVVKMSKSICVQHFSSHFLRSGGRERERERELAIRRRADGGQHTTQGGCAREADVVVL